MSDEQAPHVYMDQDELLDMITTAARTRSPTETNVEAQQVESAIFLVHRRLFEYHKERIKTLETQVAELQTSLDTLMAENRELKEGLIESREHFRALMALVKDSETY